MATKVKTRKAQFLLNLPHEDRERWAKAAAERGISMSEFLRRAVANELANGR